MKIFRMGLYLVMATLPQFVVAVDGDAADIIYRTKQGVDVGGNTYTAHLYQVNKTAIKVNQEDAAAAKVAVNAYPDGFAFFQKEKTPRQYWWWFAVQATISNNNLCAFLPKSGNEGSDTGLMNEIGEDFPLVGISNKWLISNDHPIREIQAKIADKNLSFESQDWPTALGTKFPKGKEEIVTTMFQGCKIVPWEQLSTAIKDNITTDSAQQVTNQLIQPEQQQSAATVMQTCNSKKDEGCYDLYIAQRSEIENIKSQRSQEIKRAKNNEADLQNQIDTKNNEISIANNEITNLQKQLDGMLEKEKRAMPPLFYLVIPLLALLVVMVPGLYVVQLWLSRRQVRKPEEPLGLIDRSADKLTKEINDIVRIYADDIKASFQQTHLSGLFNQSIDIADDLVEEHPQLQRVIAKIEEAARKKPQTNSRPGLSKEVHVIDDSFGTQETPSETLRQEFDDIMNKLSNTDFPKISQGVATSNVDAMQRQIETNIKFGPLLSKMILQLDDYMEWLKEDHRHSSDKLQRDLADYKTKLKSKEESISAFEEVRKQYEHFLFDNLTAAGYLDTSKSADDPELYKQLYSTIRHASQPISHKFEFETYVRSLIDLGRYLSTEDAQALPFFLPSGLDGVMESIREKRSFITLYTSTTPQEALQGQWNGILQRLYRAILLLKTYWPNEIDEMLIARLTHTKSAGEVLLRLHHMIPHDLTLPVDRQWIDKNKPRVVETQNQGVNRTLESTPAFQSKIKPMAQQSTTYCDVANWGYDLVDHPSDGEPSRLIAKEPGSKWEPVH